jgi:hypothetical protein
MKEITEFDKIRESIIVTVAILAIVTYWLLSSGMVTITPDTPSVTATPLPTPTPEPTSSVTIITTPPTPAAIDIPEIYIDPFAPGIRSEGQWYKWYRPEVQGLKDMQIGVIVYRHAFLDRYTWYNPSTGNYFSQRPSAGNRYFAIWVHEEMIGTNQTDDPSVWAFDENNFAVQINGQLFTNELNKSYLPVIRIKEFDNMKDYYNVIQAPPFGYYVAYTGHNPEAGGYAAQKLTFLRMGKGNAIDGYILYEVPRDTLLEDIQVNGDFAAFGGAQWTFPR